MRSSWLPLHRALLKLLNVVGLRWALYQLKMHKVILAVMNMQISWRQVKLSQAKLTHGEGGSRKTIISLFYLQFDL